MIFQETNLKGCFKIKMEPRLDERGWFSRFFCASEFKKIGHEGEWVQMNHSYTAAAGTIRGMHYQEDPHGEIKLVKCISGKVFDVVIDLRADSATYLQHVVVELSPDDWQMIYVPKGFAHGFQSVLPNSQLLYHHSAFYHPGAERGIRFNDPVFAIDWPLPVSSISDRDLQHPVFNV